jgi:hypothetical protein
VGSELSLALAAAARTKHSGERAGPDQVYAAESCNRLAPVLRDKADLLGERLQDTPPLRTQRRRVLGEPGAALSSQRSAIRRLRRRFSSSSALRRCASCHNINSVRLTTRLNREADFGVTSVDVRQQA